jgi:streptogramin lyase
MDHEGTMWAANNYTYAPAGHEACASDLVLRFAPDGSYYPGSPYHGGGLSGAGYGIDRDRYGRIWVSNFGFAAEECLDQPPHDTLSLFDAAGSVRSPSEGFTPAGIDWPQGLELSPAGDAWVANCNGDSVTIVSGDDPTRSTNLTDLGVSKPFDVAFGSDGNAYVTGTASNNVAVVSPDGTPVPGSPLSGYHKPMGITANSTGELWIANSGIVDLPCPVKTIDAVPPPSLGYIDPATGERDEYHGGGLLIPWGISVDGHDNVWVSNFGGLRLSAFCGRDESPYCPEGVGRGDPLSPDVFGFEFDGLRRATATATDSAGNVWVTNNWKEDPEEINPGGYEVVVFLGIAGPMPVPPAPEPLSPAPEPPAPPPAPPVATPPRFTG